MKKLPGSLEVQDIYGAAEGNRTPTMLPSADFESAASASSATAAWYEENNTKTEAESQGDSLGCVSFRTGTHLRQPIKMVQ